MNITKRERPLEKLDLPALCRRLELNPQNDKYLAADAELRIRLAEKLIEQLEANRESSEKLDKVLIKLQWLLITATVVIAATGIAQVIITLKT